MSTRTVVSGVRFWSVHQRRKTAAASTRRDQTGTHRRQAGDWGALAAGLAFDAVTARVGGAGAGAAAERTTLYHGSPAFHGDEFALDIAIRQTRRGTGLPCIYLTDDGGRAVSQFGREGHVVRTRVPTAFANAIRQTDREGRIEYFVNTQEGVNILNEGITDIMTGMEAFRRWADGTL
jgi:hypothetical protein